MSHVGRVSGEMCAILSHNCGADPTSYYNAKLLTIKNLLMSKERNVELAWLKLLILLDL